MKRITLLDIDLAKNESHVHSVDQFGHSKQSRKFTRKKLLEFVFKHPPCTVAMEACAGDQYLSRKFQKWGHEVKLIAPQYILFKRLMWMTIIGLTCDLLSEKSRRWICLSRE